MAKSGGLRGRHRRRGPSHFAAERNPQNRPEQACIVASPVPLRSPEAAHTRQFRDGREEGLIREDSLAEGSQFELSGDFRARTLSLRKPKIKTGTVLIREWQGKNHRVTATKEGFIYGGKHGSLAQIARMPRMRFLLFKDLCASRNSPEGF